MLASIKGFGVEPYKSVTYLCILNIPEVAQIPNLLHCKLLKPKTILKVSVLQRTDLKSSSVHLMVLKFKFCFSLHLKPIFFFSKFGRGKRPSAIQNSQHLETKFDPRSDSV